MLQFFPHWFNHTFKVEKLKLKSFKVWWGNVSRNSRRKTCFVLYCKLIKIKDENETMEAEKPKTISHHHQIVIQSFWSLVWRHKNIIYLPQDEWKRTRIYYVWNKLSLTLTSLMLFRLRWKRKSCRERWHLSAKLRMRFLLKANQEGEQRMEDGPRPDKLIAKAEMAQERTP